MLEDLNLTKEGGYIHSKQEVGNCSWASVKAALGALFRQYALNENDGQIIYKLFTTFSRTSFLKSYLEEIKPPDYELLELIKEKLNEKRGFKETRLMLTDFLKNHVTE